MSEEGKGKEGGGIERGRRKEGIEGGREGGREAGKEAGKEVGKRKVGR